MSSIHIRALTESDADFLKYLDSQVKWGFSQKSPKILLEFSETAYIAEDSFTQQPYGIVFTYYYSPRTGWIGLLIVDEKFRKKGIGSIFFSKAINHLENIGCKEILLDAVPETVSFYKSFQFVEIKRSLRLKISISTLLNSLVSSPISEHVQKDHISEISKFDMLIFGAKRNKTFLTMYKNLNSEGAICFQDNMVKGYGFIHYSENSFSIGPLVARNSNIALDIISKLIQIGTRSQKKSEWIFIGTTETSSIPLQFFYQLGFKEYNYSLRMRYGSDQRKEIRSNLIYCIASPEMG